MKTYSFEELTAEPESFSVDEVYGITAMDKAKQVVGSIGRAAVGGLAAVPDLIATLAERTDARLDADNPLRSEPPGTPRSHYTTARMAQAIRSAADKVLPEANPNLQDRFWLNDVPSGLGSAASMIGPGGLAGLAARGAGRAAMRAAAVTTATGMGFASEFDDAFDRSIKAGADPDEALAKSLGYASVAAMIENKLGAGRLLRRYMPDATAAMQALTAKGVAGNVLKDLAAGFVEEGAQRVAQNAIVDGQLSVEGAGREGAAGAVVQALLGIPVSARSRTSSDVGEIPKPIEAAGKEVFLPTDPQDDFRLDVEESEADLQSKAALEQANQFLEQVDAITKADAESGLVSAVEPSGPGLIQMMREAQKKQGRQNIETGLVGPATVYLPDYAKPISEQESMSGVSEAIEGGGDTLIDQALRQDLSSKLSTPDPTALDVTSETTPVDIAVMGENPQRRLPPMREDQQKVLDVAHQALIDLENPKLQPDMSLVMQLEQVAPTIKRLVDSRIDQAIQVNAKDSDLTKLIDLQNKLKSFTDDLVARRQLSDESSEVVSTAPVVPPPSAAKPLTLADRTVAKIESIENAIKQNTFSDPLMLTPLALTALKFAKVAIRAGQSIAQAVRAAVAAARRQYPDHAGDDAELIGVITRELETPTREHAIKIDSAPDIAPAVKELVRNRTYEPLSAQEANRRAADVMARAGGIAEAIGVFADASNGMHEAVRTKLGSLILKQSSSAERSARASGDMKAADQIAEATARFIDQHILPRSTEIAQSLQAFADFGSMTPAGHTQFYRRVIDQAGESVRRGYGGLANWIADQMRLANAATLEDLTRDRGFQGDVRQAVDSTLEADPEIGAALRKEASEEFGSLGPIVDHHLRAQGPGKLSDSLKRQGVPNPEAAADKILKEWQDKMTRKRKALRERINAQRQSNATQPTPIDRLIANKLRQLRLRLSRVVRQHHLEQAAVGKTLADRLVLDAGFSGASATMLADSIRNRFRKLATDRKRAILQRLTTPRAKQFKRKEVADKIIEFTNLGGFDDRQFWDGIADKFGLPAYDPAVAADIVKRSNALQLLPDGSVQRIQATQDLMNYIGRAKGVSSADLAWGFWYANTLSGFVTQAVNLSANVYSLVSNLGVQAARNPASMPRVLQSVAEGFKQGVTEAGFTLKTGQQAVKTQKIEPQGALELKKWEGWAAPLNAWKYVGRAMAAGDILFYLPAREAKYAAMALDVAKRQKLTGEALDRRVSQLMGKRDDAGRDLVAEAEQAVMLEEGDLMSVGQNPDEAWRRRRLAQLLDNNRVPELRESANDYALRVTYNNKPYGVLGIIAQGINVMRREAPILNIVVPFVNVVANVTNEALNFTPVGTFRAALGHGGQVGNWRFGGDLYGKPASRDAVVDLHVKAAMGTAMIAGLSALGAIGMDSEDDPMAFQVTGAGPSEKSKRDQLRDTGWIPYSIKVRGRWYAYGNTPLAIGLSVVGNYLDNKRYGKMNEADALNRVAWAMFEAGHVITQQSFLDSAASLFGALDRNSPSSAGDRLLQEMARSSTSFVVPNLLRQIDRLFDPTVYQATDAQSAVINSLPFVRRLGKPALNALGESVARPVTSRFTSPTSPDELSNVLARKKAWVLVPEARDGLTKDNVYDIVEARGPMLKKALTSALPAIKELRPEDAKRVVNRLSRRTTLAAEAKLKLLPSQRKVESNLDLSPAQ